MPVQYTSIIEEHNAVRLKAGIFDTSHRGEFLIEGKDAEKFIQKVVARDISKINKNKCIYTVMCNEKGGVIDDLFIYKFNQESYMLVTNAGTIQKDHAHLALSKKGFDVCVANISDETAKIDLQSRESENILKKIIDIDYTKLKRFDFVEIKADSYQMIISRSGYTGEDGFEIYLNKNNVAELWNNLLDIGKEFGLKPCGLGARDTLRLECCYSLYGHELSDYISPIEADIAFTVNFDKKEFIGKESLKQNQERKNIAFILEKGIPRERCIIQKDNTKIGYATSGTLSPTLKKGVGLALIKKEFAIIGTEIDINIREKLYKAKIVKKPFYIRGDVK